jgi:hypothetical protein
MPESARDIQLEGFLTPQPELFRELAPAPPFLAHVSVQQYSFLSTERRDIYATILYFLYLRRQAHEIEKYHNDIFDAVQPRIEEYTDADYSLGMFRTDMDQLVAWGNLERRLEPYRLQRISDRRLQKFLYRLSDETRCLLDSLITLRHPHDLNRVLLDQDHLIDIEEYMERADKIKENGSQQNEEQLRRLARCFVEIDKKCLLISNEITEFGARIATFNTSPFQLETLPEIIDWLDRYVDQYLQRVAKLGPVLYHKLRMWESGAERLLLENAHEATRAHFLANPLSGPWADQLRTTDEVMADIVPFFSPEGTFAELCQRVNEQVRVLVRKIRQYLEDIRRRNIRIQALRKRTREVMHGTNLPLDELRTWIEELYGSGHQFSDLAGGTPSRRAAPPRPTYWRRRVARPPFQGSYLERKKGTLELKRELEKAKIARFGEFINSKLLHGDESHRISEVTLASPMDVRTYLDSVKSYVIGRKLERRRLPFRLIRPEHESCPVEFSGDKWKFSSPDYRIEKRNI